MLNKLLISIMLPSNIKAVLEKIQSRCDSEIRNLNLGGCGVFAYLVCKELTSHGIESEVITHSEEIRYSPKNVKSNIKDRKEMVSCYAWDINGLDRTHVGVRFKYNGVIFTYDSVRLRREARSFGERDDGKWKCNYPFGEGMSYKEMKKLADDVSDWNPDFDRKQIPLLKKIIKEAFKEMKV